MNIHALYTQAQQKLSRWCRKLKQDVGAVSVEFAIVAPFFLASTFWTFEAGHIMLQRAMLERGLDIAVRELRLGTGNNLTSDYLRGQICANTIAIPNCTSELLLDMHVVDLENTIEKTSSCHDRSTGTNPLTSWNQGLENEVVFIRACVMFDPVLPEAITLFPGSGGNRIPLFAESAFVNEPD